MKKPELSLASCVERLSQTLPATVPEIESVNYDLWTLRITVRFEGVRSPSYMSFDEILGFRVLDEGDLIEFWNPKTRPDGWLWRVGADGWFDLESSRSGFISKSTRQNTYKEYLLVGTNDCVSVLAFEEPTIDTPSP